MDKTIAVPPHTLFYRDQGTGIPTLLLHGFGEDSAIWDNQVDSLSATCRLIIPDLPGSGRSSALTSATPTPTSPTSPISPISTPISPISIEKLATVVKDLLDQLKINQCILIGHSMGGYITLAFAALYPERLHAFGLFHSTAYPDSEEKKTTRRKAIEFIRSNGSAPFIRQSTPNLFSARTRERRPELIEATIARYSGFSPESLIAYYEAMIARPDRTEVLRQFTGPVLFIIGEDDTIIPTRQTLEQCHLPSISHLHLIPDTGHLAMLENAEKSNQLLRDFLNFVSRI